MRDAIYIFPQISFKFMRKRPLQMTKIKLPFISPIAFSKTAKTLIEHLRLSSHKIGAPPGTLT